MDEWFAVDLRELSCLLGAARKRTLDCKDHSPIRIDHGLLRALRVTSGWPFLQLVLCRNLLVHGATPPWTTMPRLTARSRPARSASEFLFLERSTPIYVISAGRFGLKIE